MRALLTVLLCGPVLAQTGTLDQVSPHTNASFNVNADFLVWQQQVRAGIAGQLEGFDLILTGAVGAHCDLVLRLGDGWNTGPALWTGAFTKTVSTQEQPFFDVTSASINLSAGDTFVIEVVGDNTGMGLLGSYEDPNINPPQYPEELYLNGPPCYSNCGWRHAFQTWMLGGGGSNLHCDPANVHTGGTYVTLANSSPSGPGVFHLEATGGPPGEFGYFLVSLGFNDPGTPVSNGNLCLTAPIGRYAPAAGGTFNSIGTFDGAGVLQNIAGTSSVGSGYDVLATLPTPPGGTISAGTSYYFQCWFRDGQRSNFSNVVEF